jgi:hypothetical protein
VIKLNDIERSKYRIKIEEIIEKEGNITQEVLAKYGLEINLGWCDNCRYKPLFSTITACEKEPNKNSITLYCRGYKKR